MDMDFPKRKPSRPLTGCWAFDSTAGHEQAFHEEEQGPSEMALQNLKWFGATFGPATLSWLMENPVHELAAKHPRLASGMARLWAWLSYLLDKLKTLLPQHLRMETYVNNASVILTNASIMYTNAVNTKDIVVGAVELIHAALCRAVVLAWANYLLERVLEHRDMLCFMIRNMIRRQQKQQRAQARRRPRQQ